MGIKNKKVKNVHILCMWKTMGSLTPVLSMPWCCVIQVLIPTAGHWSRCPLTCHPKLPPYLSALLQVDRQGGGKGWGGGGGGQEGCGVREDTA